MTELQQPTLDPHRLPKHIGIIMDGNGRWAEKRGLKRSEGHREGSLRTKEIIKEIHALDIPFLSLYAFSTENWKRPRAEILNLRELLLNFIQTDLKELQENGVRIHIMGDMAPFDTILKRALDTVIRSTEENTKLHVNIALNYGGQDEIIRASRLIAEDVKSGKISPNLIDRDLFSTYLYTDGQPELDYLIRPSGELRVSNFMLYQMAYSEMYFSDVLWPDFNREALHSALIEYQNRNRRFGGITHE